MDDIIWNEERHAPFEEPLVVANQEHWAFARKVVSKAITFQMSWPFIVFDAREFWLVTGTYNKVRLDFMPTHWGYIRVNPPPVVPPS